MSRVGMQPIKIPSGVSVTFEGSNATVKGPKGTLTRGLPKVCGFEQKGDTLRVTRPTNSKPHRSMHGLTRTLLANMVIGVTEGFLKELEIVGVGYRAESKGKELILSLGYSHPIHFKIPEGIKIEVPSPTQIKVSGIDKEKVGQVAADIRRLRPPEPYKGKGILYAGEHIHRKAGKAAVGA
ncbi:MAG: 50S ribosomal protein L6 [Candidatus Latescibacteria bacterium]|nr:50S ribosomal protein L6 [Candidatus Latescibacterota bacterium]NIM20811.1 50S ribosomal protein L6 [Candidatus Latescibacterota bacterium]NIM64377.1 50S ribosomal protein L6 [Candidatus Latescibacterota bacterium]NIO00528.1 50S ribosomal protein L6 [Candidatus Latescibacterota bacterium]NIO26931.1 50S ribosomal protein L6 [Candidatus Latescibacterota bacterium]